MTGIVYGVGVGPGDPELLTVRAARAIAEADLVVHDGLVRHGGDGANVRIAMTEQQRAEALAEIDVGPAHDVGQERHDCLTVSRHLADRVDGQHTTGTRFVLDHDIDAERAGYVGMITANSFMKLIRVARNALHAYLTSSAVRNDVVTTSASTRS